MFQDVLTAAQAGGRWANRVIWTEYSPQVAAYLRARGSLEPDDLTSEVFLTVFERLAEFEGDEEKFRAFVFTIAHRRLVDEFRKRAHRGFQSEWSEESDTRTVNSAESHALERIGNENARALLDELPPDQRDVLVLRIIGDLTVEQIAEILGKRPGAIKALQRRGLERLRKKVGATRTLFAVSNYCRV
jgi:RNA polymerase sigma-70 factor (ECF subfamily)